MLSLDNNEGAEFDYNSLTVVELKSTPEETPEDPDVTP